MFRGPFTTACVPAIAVGALLALAPGLVGDAVAAAPSAPAAAQAREPIAVAEPIAAPWPALQRIDGSYPDFMATRGAAARDLYGDAMLGYGLLKTGLERHDDRAVSSGLRGLVHAVRYPRSYHSIVFEKLALAAAYNLARERIPLHPLFSAARARWESRLRAVRPTFLSGSDRYFNQHLVEAVTVLEIGRSGLRSEVPGTVSHDPAAAVALAERLVNAGLPAALRSRTARIGPTSSATLTSDGALAYHALTLGFYARALQLMGDRASPQAHSLLERLARASWALMGPDGDVAYFGRSQEQAWTLALTGYGAEVAAVRASPRWSAFHRAAAARVIQRLLEVHVGGPGGLYLTPAFRIDPAAAIRAQEDYVSGTAYAGLTLVALGWAHDRFRPGRPQAAGLAAARPSSIGLDRGGRRFAAVSTGRVWYVVRQLPAAARELNSGAGVVALKVRDRGGRWNDVLPHGAVGRPGDGTGPLLLTRAGPAHLVGRSVRLGRGRSVRLAADLVTSEGARIRRTTVELRPAGCGVRIVPGSRRGERWEYSALLHERPRPVRRGKRTVRSGSIQAGYRGAGHIVTGARLLSPSFGPLVRSRMSVKAPVAFSVGLAGRCAAR